MRLVNPLDLLKVIVPSGFGQLDMVLIRLPRKSSKRLLLSCPYRKPTQVVKERILRCSSESRPRNSAKLPCNFGRRGASSNLLEKPQ